MSRLTLLCMLVSVGAFAQSGEEREAGDTSEVDRDVGPLRERIRPVSGHLFLKKGRFELSPSVTVSIRDAFFTKFVFGASAAYHPTDWLGIGVRGGYSLPIVAPSALICTPASTGAQRSCAAPTYEDLTGIAPGQISLLGGADLQLSPLYGKLAVLAEQFLHFDMYAIVGVAALQYVGPGAASPTESRFSVGANVGGGLRIFLNRWLTTRFELRDTIYPEVVYPVLDRAQVRHQLFLEVGISMFFPPTFGEG